MIKIDDEALKVAAIEAYGIDANEWKSLDQSVQSGYMRAVEPSITAALEHMVSTGQAKHGYIDFLEEGWSASTEVGGAARCLIINLETKQ